MTFTAWPSVARSLTGLTVSFWPAVPVPVFVPDGPDGVSPPPVVPPSPLACVTVSVIGDVRVVPTALVNSALYS